jgi:hypothetical protein
MLEFSLTGQEVSRRGSVGSDDNGHTTVVALRADPLFAVCGVGSIGIFPRSQWEDPSPSLSRVRSADPILALFEYLDNRTGDTPLWGVISGL